MIFHRQIEKVKNKLPNLGISNLKNTNGTYKNKPANTIPIAPKYSIRGLSITGLITKYTDMIRTKIGITIGT